MSQNIKIQPREPQRAKLAILKRNFNLSDAEAERCLFFSTEQEEPWIPSDILEAIARQTGGFKVISSVYDQVIPSLDQIVYAADVVDDRDRHFPRSGVAKIGERPGGIEIDPHELAENRALSASLTAAGFDPFRAGSVVGINREKLPAFSGPPLNDREQQLHTIEDEGALRRKDLAQIHKIATDKGLIVDKDMTRYRAWLKKHFFTPSAAMLSAGSRASVISELNALGDDEAFLIDVPDEFHTEALIA